MVIAFKHRYKSGSLIGTGTIKFRPYTVASPLPQLATPQNVTANGTVVSWDEVENATSYEVLADGTSIGMVEAQNGKTWVLNNSGRFDSLAHIEVTFNSNNFTFYGIRSDTMILYYYTDDTNKRKVFNSTGDGWINTAYRTITFETAPTGDLLRWLQANATKQ